MASGTSAKRVIILGSTGSIGTQTLDVVAHLNALHAAGHFPFPLRVVGLGAGRNAALLARQAAQFNVPDVAVLDGAAPAACRARRGPDAAERLVREVDADLVVAAMVGASGLPATLAAVHLGRDVALANKETLVAAGSLIIPAARASGSRLLPVDSEHSAVWQCLQGARPPHPGALPPVLPPVPPMACGPDVARIVLTASGGALRHLPAADMARATPAQALKHPTWTMGAKVTIDSASLTNKAFEVIEAHWLFGVEAERIGVLIHPQSVVHSLVEFVDGSLIAQLGSADMRHPIQYALTWPARPVGCSQRMPLSMLSRLEFSEPDPARYPALDLAYRAIREGGTSGAVFSAASEAAVEAFLAPGNESGAALPFGRLPQLAREAMDELGHRPAHSLHDILEADAQARRFVHARLASASLAPARAEATA